MALYTNNVTLKGFLGKDAETIATKQGRSLTVLSLATKSGYKDKQKNEWVNHTEWHRIIAFGTPADYAKNQKKGEYVEVEGELRSTEREVEIVKDKKKTKTTTRNWEVRASKVTKLAPPKAGENQDAESITEEDAA